MKYFLPFYLKNFRSGVIPQFKKQNFYPYPLACCVCQAIMRGEMFSKYQYCEASVGQWQLLSQLPTLDTCHVDWVLWIIDSGNLQRSLFDKFLQETCVDLILCRYNCLIKQKIKTSFEEITFAIQLSSQTKYLITCSLLINFHFLRQMIFLFFSVPVIGWFPTNREEAAAERSWKWLLVTKQQFLH